MASSAKTLAIMQSECKGTLTAPASKSHTHRAMIASLLCNGTSSILGPLKSADTFATLNAIMALGASVRHFDWGIEVQGRGFPLSGKTINAAESGTTFRMLVPVVALSGSGTLVAEGSLSKRPMFDIVECFKAKGIEISGGTYPPISLKSKLLPGAYEISGSVTSQFISGLMFSLPVLEQGSEIKIIGTINSKPYIRMSVDVLSKFGISSMFDEQAGIIRLRGSQKFKPTKYSVEGDYSSSAFFLAYAAISGSLAITGLVKNSLQADSAIINILRRMGSKIRISDNSVNISNSSLEGMEIDVSDCPDLLPILSVLGCFSKGRTVLKNVSRIRLKESDRVGAIAAELSRMGAKIKASSDTLEIKHSILNYATVHSHGDHRIAMSLAIAGKCAKGCRLDGYECVSKSFPDFFSKLESVSSKG